MTILIKQAQLNDQPTDLLIVGNRIAKIAPCIDTPADQTLDGSNRAILPTFHNLHTHAAMSLMRGYADDIELHTWLTDHIWPLEAKLTEEDVYHGTRLACLEMIKTGTTFFNDMYWHAHGSARAAESLGLRAAISGVFIGLGSPAELHKNIDSNAKLFSEISQYSNRIQFMLGPHAPYTVCREGLEWAHQFAEENDLHIHIHLAETQKEFDDSVEQHGLSPVAYLHSLGLLSERLLAAHSIYLTNADRELLAENNVTVLHNPCSNQKLASGTFNFYAAQQSGISIALGTDGACSNNNLDMLSEMKHAALLAKVHRQDPTVATAEQIFHSATRAGAEAIGLDSGRIAEGALADLMLVDLNHYSLVPNHNLISNLVYAASPECIQTVICDGNILMQDRYIADEAEIIANARATQARLF